MLFSRMLLAVVCAMAMITPPTRTGGELVVPGRHESAPPQDQPHRPHFAPQWALDLHQGEEWLECIALRIYFFFLESCLISCTFCLVFFFLDKCLPSFPSRYLDFNDELFSPYSVSFCFSLSFSLQFPDSSLPVATRVSELRRVESPVPSLASDTAAVDMAVGDESSDNLTNSGLMDLAS